MSPPPHATLTRTLQARAVIPEDRGQRTELLHESLREAEFKAGGLSNRTAYLQPLAPHLRVQRRKGCWGGVGEGSRKEEREKRGRGGRGEVGGGGGEGAELSLIQRPVERPLDKPGDRGDQLSQMSVSSVLMQPFLSKRSQTLSPKLFLEK